jgi:predicted dehydrogenase
MASAYASSPLVELRTCFTRNPERRQAFAADFGCGQDESLDAVLARDDIDGIVITAPNDQHAPIIEAAAARGKHVYTEKPVAVNLADLRRIRAAVLGSGIVFACGHSARRLSGLRAMKSLLDSGAAGAPSMVEAVFGNERGLELKEGDWRADPDQAPGGPLTQLGIHQIDNLQYLLAPASPTSWRSGCCSSSTSRSATWAATGCPRAASPSTCTPRWPGSATSWTSPGGATRARPTRTRG